MHLTAADPAGIERFVRFLDGPCAAASRLLLVGDLFNVWIAPGQAREPALAPVFERLRSLASRIDVGFVEGNRDFAASPELMRLGVRRLDDVEVVESGARRVVVTHGDLLCTKDVRYQAFRRIARTQTVRHVLRRLSDRGAVRVADTARKGSERETSMKAHGDMGLDPIAVAAMLRTHDADALVCGHVHWGKRFVVEVEGRKRDVVVLGAWEERPTYAEIEGGVVRFVAFE